MKDITRIEYSIIPMLLESYVKVIYKQKRIKSLIKDLKLLERQYRAFYNDIRDDTRRVRLYRQSDVITNKIIAYMKGFTAQKAILTIIGWLNSLAAVEAIGVAENTPYWDYLTNIGKSLQENMEKEEGFAELQESTLPHILAIHEIAINDGYFLRD